MREKKYISTAWPCWFKPKLVNRLKTAATVIFFTEWTDSSIICFTERYKAGDHWIVANIVIFLRQFMVSHRALNTNQVVHYDKVDIGFIVKKIMRIRHPHRLEPQIRIVWELHTFLHPQNKLFLGFICFKVLTSSNWSKFFFQSVVISRDYFKVLLHSFKLTWGERNFASCVEHYLHW